MAGIRLLLQHRLDQRAEFLKAATEIGESGCDPNPCACLQFNHPNRIPGMACTSAGPPSFLGLKQVRHLSRYRGESGEPFGTKLDCRP